MTITSEQITQEKDENRNLKNFLKSQYLRNQKLWLLEALIRQNDFEDFMKGFFAIGHNIDLPSHQPLMKSIFDMIEWFIEPFYRPISPSRLFKIRRIKLFTLQQSKQKELSKKELSRIDFSSSSSTNKFDLDLIFNFLGKLETLLKIPSLYLGISKMAFTKILRILLHFKDQNKKQYKTKKHKKGKSGNSVISCKKLDDRILHLLQEYLIPSLPGQKANLSIVLLIWKLLKYYTFTQRYQIYEDWICNKITPNPFITMSFGVAIEQTRHFMNTIRNDKEIDKYNARIFAKISHSTPIIVLRQALNILEAFNNLIPIMVSSLSYCSSLSLDIIVFLILRAASQRTKKIMKEEEGIISQWFNNYALLLGQLLKKYYKVDLEGIFVFLCNKLCSDNFQDHLSIIFFEQLLAKMSGYEIFRNFTDIQLSSLAGGIALQTEAFKFTDQVKSARKSSKALAEFLWKKENRVTVYGDVKQYKLALPFYIMALISQIKNGMLYKAPLSRNLVVVNTLFDKMNETLIQFKIFLKYHFETSEHYQELLSDNSLDFLVKNWKISLEHSFQIVRNGNKPIYKLSKDGLWKKQVAKYKKIFEDVKFNKFYSNNRVKDDLITPVLIEKRKAVWDKLPPEFYTLFWILHSGNISVPKEAYSSQIREMNMEIKMIDLNKGKGEERSKMEKNIDRIRKNIGFLKQEMEKLLKEKDKIYKFMNLNLKSCIKGLSLKINDLIPFIQYCLIPRLRLSPSDTLYCVNFIKYLHKVRESSFQTQLELIWNLINIMLPSIQCCSENEAYNLGVFFNEILKLTINWSSDMKLYNDIQKFNELKGEKNSDQTINRTRVRILKMYEKLTNKMKVLLKKHSFIEVRNIIIILNRIIQHYPETKESSDAIFKVLKARFSESAENKNSLDYQVKGYKVALLKREKSLASWNVKMLAHSSSKAKLLRDSENRRAEDDKANHRKLDMSSEKRYTQGSLHYNHNHRSLNSRNGKDRNKVSKSDSRTKEKEMKRKSKDESNRHDRKRNKRESRSRLMNLKSTKYYDDRPYLDKRTNYHSNFSYQKTNDDFEVKESISKRIKGPDKNDKRLKISGNEKSDKWSKNQERNDQDKRRK